MKGESVPCSHEGRDNDNPKLVVLYTSSLKRWRLVLEQYIKEPEREDESESLPTQGVSPKRKSDLGPCSEHLVSGSLGVVGARLVLKVVHYTRSLFTNDIRRL